MSCDFFGFSCAPVLLLMARPGSPWHYVQIGARVPFLLQLCVYLIPVYIYAFALPPPPAAGGGLAAFLRANALAQLGLFLACVNLPALLTERMTYVDIGWPCGLTLIAVRALRDGDGLPLRRWLVCGCLFCHGARMAVGAVLLFGSKSGWTFRFDQDLPRYRYAKHRWVHVDGMPNAHWWLKMQHDCAQQGFMNATFLALPAALAAFNRTPTLNSVEVAGVALWVCSYVFENWADLQKNAFLRDVKKAAAASKSGASSRGGTAVLGLAPWDGFRYRLWTWCRHPNYLGELGCWCAFCLIGLSQIPAIAGGWRAAVALTWALALIPAVFYDCLVFWTGAAPSEYFSVRKREGYRDYQKIVPCLFPRPLGWLLGKGDATSAHMVSGWPQGASP